MTNKVQYLLTALCLVVASFSSASAQTTAGAIPASFFGMSILTPNNETVPSTIQYGIARSWDTVPAMDWADLNPSSGNLAFSAMDNFIAQNQSRLPNVIYTLGRTPQWASSNPNAAGHYGDGQCAPPADLRNWDNYVRLAVIHAAGQIKYWELWNEPQDSQYYCGTVASMVMMAQHASTIIKSIDPAAVIISPSTGGGSIAGPQWLASFLAAGGSRYVDAIGFHGYDNTTAESVPTVITSYQSVMHKYGVASKPLFDTAASWGNTTSLTVPQQAAFLAKYYLLHWSWGVSNLTWYAYDGIPWGGLIDTSSKPTIAATAYTQINNWMVNATMTSPCSKDANNIWSCILTKANGYQSEVTWNSSASMSVTVPSQYNEYTDLTGLVTPITNNIITIGNEPVLLDNAGTTSPPPPSGSPPPELITGSTAGSSSIETLGIISANQAVNGLGFNLDSSQDWEWSAAAAAGATYARIQCSWSILGQQTLPPNNAPGSPQFVEDPNCTLGFISAKKYGIHPTVVAAYGPPYHQIVGVTLPNGAAIGATSLDVELAVSRGGDTLADIKFPYDYICFEQVASQANASPGCHSFFTSRHSYEGTLITGVSQTDSTHATVTLASALTQALPPSAGTATGCSMAAGSLILNCTSGNFNSLIGGTTQITVPGLGKAGATVTTVILSYQSPTQVTLNASPSTALTNVNVTFSTLYNVNEILYPSTASESKTDPSVIAYGNYVSFLASDIASYGLTADVEIWNEPVGSSDPWDNRCNLYDTALFPAGNCTSSTPTPAGTILNTANYGFAASLQDKTFPAGITLTWNGTWNSGWSSVLGPRMYQNSGTYLNQPSLVITKESFHTYGFEPEEMIWTKACMLAALQAKTAPANNALLACPLPGEIVGANFGSAVQWDLQAKLTNPAYGIGHSITETNILPPVAGLRIPQARFIMRQYLGYQAMGVTPIEFFKLYDTGALTDPNFSFIERIGNTNTYTVNPEYTAISGFMADIKPIGNMPVTSYTTANLPSVYSYSGTYPLSTVHMVGARSGATANSDMFAVWQRSFTPGCSANGQNNAPTCNGSWITQASPAAGPAVINIPSGMSVSAVINLTTRQNVSYTSSGDKIQFQVADDPIEVMVDPLP